MPDSEHSSASTEFAPIVYDMLTAALTPVINDLLAEKWPLTAIHDMISSQIAKIIHEAALVSQQQSAE